MTEFPTWNRFEMIFDLSQMSGHEWTYKLMFIRRQQKHSRVQLK